MTYFQRKSNNKFNAKKTEYNGKKYDSKGEAGFAMELDYRIKAGELLSYERQVKISIDVNGVHICNYYADFIATDKHGAKILYEYKGLRLPLFDMKWKLLQALKDELFPEGIEFVLVQHSKPWKRK